MYGAQLLDFVQASEHSILGELLNESSGDVELNQRNAWSAQIRILQALPLAPALLAQGRIYFEMTVPRLGRRADVVLLIGPLLVILEFKVGESSFESSAIDQVWDYALDFKYFHESSHAVTILPILVATDAKMAAHTLKQTIHNDDLFLPVKSTPDQLSSVIDEALALTHANPVDVYAWERGRYMPTPTIVEAARALYAGHSVAEVSRSDAGAKNLKETTQAIDRIIDASRTDNAKSICFVTGVPGAGKTLVGLDVANRHLDSNSETFSVFLSGNGPLVAVLREALTRDRVSQSLLNGKRIRKVEAKKEVETFIQNVHHFRDEYLRDEGAPPEHVVLFDEAQRAWNLEQTSAFMQRKKGRAGFNQSEPEFLISCLERHPDWAVIVCLIGSGQEINTGEGGIDEWFDAINRRFPEWRVHLSPTLTQGSPSEALYKVLDRPSTYQDDSLHLSVSMRSFRAESLSRFVHEVLNFEVAAAQHSLRQLNTRYPIVITRDIQAAKAWLKQHARGTERYGMIVSSQAERLKPHAIDVRIKTDPVKWFLDGPEDTRASYYLEEVATEFQVQGLELDWACVVWDGDLRAHAGSWSHHQFRGSKWNRINKPDRRRYLENAYRVLLTRARQGMVIVVPEGNAEDPTRSSDFYDPTYAYLRSVGLSEI